MRLAVTMIVGRLCTCLLSSGLVCFFVLVDVCEYVCMYWLIGATDSIVEGYCCCQGWYRRGILLLLLVSCRLVVVLMMMVMVVIHV